MRLGFYHGRCPKLVIRHFFFFCRGHDKAGIIIFIIVYNCLKEYKVDLLVDYATT